MRLEGRVPAGRDRGAWLAAAVSIGLVLMLAWYRRFISALLPATLALSLLLIGVIFSLDGLGLLGFEAAINRDYPVMFATLYFFTLLGLLMNLAGDLAYVAVDPRIDFEARRT